MSNYFVSITKFLESIWPTEALEIPALGSLDAFRVKPSFVSHDPIHGSGFKTEAILEQDIVLRLPGISFLELAIGGNQTPFTVEGRLFPHVGARFGPMPIGINLNQNWLIPMKRISESGKPDRFVPDETASGLSIRLDQSKLSYFHQEGIQVQTQFVISVPPVMIKGTNLIIGMEEIQFIFSSSSFHPALYTLGFDEGFRGIYGRFASIYWLPEIQIQDWDLPGLRLDFSDFAVGNQGISCQFQLTWDVVFDAQGNFDPIETELLGSFLNENWQIAISNASGTIRHNVPQGFSVKTYLRVPFFEAIFSAYFSLAYRTEADGKSSYTTAFAIQKESSDPVIAGYLNDEIVLTLQQFSSDGWLSDQGFSINGQVGFAIELFGFELEAEQATLAYSHSEKKDEFTFSLQHVVLGDLGEAEEAHLIFNSHLNEAGERIIDKLEITAIYTWADLQGLIPEEMQDIVGLPEDGRIEAHISWQEVENPTQSSRKLLVKLLAQGSHVDSLWAFVPQDYRPEVPEAQTMLKLSYDSVERFAPTDADGNPLPAPLSYAEREGIEVELSALLKISLPDVAQFAPPNFNLIHLETGDEDGLVTVELKASYQSNSEIGEQFQVGLSVLNPFSVDLNLPGADADFPFIHNVINQVGLQFGYQEGLEEEQTIGGKLLFEGDFRFRPLVPAGFPFADHFSSLMRQVGLDDIVGNSKISLAFTADTFDLEIAGKFEDFGIEIDIFQLLSSLSSSNEQPSSQDFEIDFDIGFQLIGFEFKLGNGEQAGANPSHDFYFSFDLKVEYSMTGLPPLHAAITLSNTEFSFGLEDLSIPLEVPNYPIDNADLARLKGPGGIWSTDSQQTYVAELDTQIAELESLLAAQEVSEILQFRYLKDKASLELKKLMLQLVMQIHNRVGQDGQPVYQGMVEADTWIHATVLSFLHVDTDIKLFFPEIKFRIPFDDPSGISIAGTGKIVGFAEDDPLRALADYNFSLGLSTEYIFAKIESTGAPIPIPSFGTKYEDGSISISKFMIGYGYSKNSFAFDFAGELILPPALIEDADSSDELGIGIRLPRHNKLAFKIDLIPVTIVKVTVVIPIPRFDLDLRSPNAPALVSTAPCKPYWDGLEFIIPDIIHIDQKHLAFSPFFGLGIIPNIKYDGDLKLGNDKNGLTLIVDDMLILIGALLGSYFVPIPFLADPNQPYFRNICVNLRVLGFELNFNLQRPFPSASPMAALEAFGLISDPMMEIDPQGSLANTIRFTLSDAYLQVPDFVLQMFPEAAKLVNQTYGFTLNLGTLIHMTQAVAGSAGPFIEAISSFAKGQSHSLQTSFASLPQSFDPWDWLVLLPPELRKFRLGGQIAGFEASACLVFATEEEAQLFIGASLQSKTPLPALNTTQETEEAKQFLSYTRHKRPKYMPTKSAQFVKSWKAEGSAEAQWQKVDGGVQFSNHGQQAELLVYQKAEIPENVSISFTIDIAQIRHEAMAGIIFCYADSSNYYSLVQQADAQGKGAIVLTKVVDNQTTTLYKEQLSFLPQASVNWVMSSYVDDFKRVFDIQISHKHVRSISDLEPLPNNQIGLLAQGLARILFTDMLVYGLRLKSNNFGKISEHSVTHGFQVNLPASKLNKHRLVKHDERLTLFQGMEFKQFEPSHLDMIPVDKLAHLPDGQASLFLGAYIKVFGGQRVRFLGRLFQDGSFALVSQAEVKPLALNILGIPISLPFEGYGNLKLVGRQKRNGYYGFIEANGYLDWSPIPNVIQLVVGTASRPASLSLHSNGEFALVADKAKVYLFNGAASIDASLSLTHREASFSGRLQFALGAEFAKDYHFENILAINIEGSGLVESFQRYRFEGRGELHFLGERFLNVAVGLDEKHAYFDLHFRKGINTGATNLERAFPILTRCELDLRGNCVFNMKRTVRPEFCLSGEGSIKVFGAEIRGKGEIKSIPTASGSSKTDYFEAMMDGNLYWQGRKWLGGKLSVGSKGLLLSGSTQFGVHLTPKTLIGTDIQIANLFLSIQLDGEFRLDSDKKSVYFVFKGSWTLGANMANTGNETNHQLFPLASRTFSFTSNAGLSTDDEYCLDLFKIDGFSFLPFDKVSIPVPAMSLKKQYGAKTMVKAGRTKYIDPSNSTKYNPAVEFYTPLGNIGIEGLFPYFNQSKTWVDSSVKELYSAYEIKFTGPDDLPVEFKSFELDFLNFEPIRLALTLDPDAQKGFPIRLKLDSGGDPVYIGL